jgi:hypothetical protein
MNIARGALPIEDYRSDGVVRCTQLLARLRPNQELGHPTIDPSWVNGGGLHLHESVSLAPVSRRSATSNQSSLRARMYGPAVRRKTEIQDRRT